MATQQDKKKPVSAKQAAANLKQAANSKQDASPVDAQDVEARRTRLKALIVLGKERGYLTFAEINDHLPEMLEAEQIEGVVSMINDMGPVGLLTRQDEIVIAKRIEEGLKHMIQAISACPATIAEILALAEKVQRDEMRIDEVIDGFIEIEEEVAVSEDISEDEESEEEVDEDEEESADDGD